MSDEKKKIIIKPETKDRVIIIDGRKYRLLQEIMKGDHVQEAIFQEFDEKQWETDIDNISEFLVSETGITAKRILKDVLNGTDMITIEKIKREIERIMEERRRMSRVHLPPRIKRGCLNIKIGKIEIPIVE